MRQSAPWFLTSTGKILGKDEHIAIAVCDGYNL